MNYFQDLFFFFCYNVLFYLYIYKNLVYYRAFIFRHNLRLGHLKYVSMGAGENTAKKSTLISDSANLKIDVLNGWWTLMPCFLLQHFHLQTSKTPECSTCTGARKELKLLTSSSFLPTELVRFYSEQHTGWLLLKTAKYVDNSFSVSSCPQQLYRLMEP